MLNIENLAFSYGRHHGVLKGVNLELGEGEIGISLGKNGSGKTTLFKNILGILKPSEGSVSLGGEDILAMSAGERARRIAYVPQDIRFGALTVFDSVLMGRVSYFGIGAGEGDYEIVRGILEDMNLSYCAAYDVDKLSGGERQKVAIARAIAQEPKLLVFDEPTGNLDIANEQLIAGEAKRLAREKNISILIAMHDLNQALSLGDKFFFLRDGVIAHQGGSEVVTEEAIFDTFDVSVRIIDIEDQRIIVGGN